MNIRITRRVDMFERAVQFRDESAITFNAHTENLFDSLESVLGEIRSAGGNQVFGRGQFRAGSIDRSQIAAELLFTLTDMEKMAESFDPAQFPNATLQFRAPRTKRLQTVRATAEAFVAATETEALQQAFIERGFEPDFHAQLQAAIFRFDTASGRKHGGLQGQVGGTTAMTAKVRLAARIVSELDAIISKQLRKTNPTQLAVWKGAIRLVNDRREPNAAAASKPVSAPVPAVAQ